MFKISKYIHTYLLPIFSLTTLLILLMSLSGCSKSNLIPPTPLKKITSTFTPKIMWSRNIGNGDGNVYLSLSPTLDTQNNTLFTTSHNGWIMALNASNGKTRWQMNTGLPLSTSITLSPTLVFAGTTNGALIALDRSTGKLIWNTTSLPSSLYAAPTYDSSTDLLIVFTHDGSITAYQAKTGKLIWQQTLPLPPILLTGNSQPIIHQGHVYIGSPTGTVWIYDIKTGHPLSSIPVATPKSSATVASMLDINATPIIQNKILYACTYQGNLIAHNIKTNTTIWAKPFSTYNNFSLTDKTLYLSDSDGNLFAINTTTGKTDWHTTILNGRRTSPPTLWHQYVVISDYEGYVHFFSATTGKYLSRISLAGNGIRGEASIGKNLLYFQTNNGKVYAIKP